MWIRARSGKSLAVLAALFLSLFVFVIAAGEARAEEQGVLPGTQWPQWCAALPGGVSPGIAPPGTAPCPPTVRPSVADTSPLDNPLAGSTANETPPAPPFPPPQDGVPVPAPGTEPPPGQHALPYPGADGGLGTKPIPPAQSAPPEGVPTPPDRRGPATSPTDQPRRPQILPEEALSLPGSATDPKPASSAPRTDGPLGSQPSSAPDQLPTAKGVPTSPPRSAVGSDGKQAPSAGENTSDPAPSRIRGSEAAHSTVRWVVEPLVPHALPNLATASRGAVHEALTQTHKTVSETVAGAMGTLESWAARWLPSGKAAQGSSDGTVPDPLDPLLPLLPQPLQDSPFFSLPGTGQVAFGGGVGLLLLGVLASVLILRRRDGPLSWISCEPPKPTSALLVPLERPG
jgi:hypothetical protein